MQGTTLHTHQIAFLQHVYQKRVWIFLLGTCATVFVIVSIIYICILYPQSFMFWEGKLSVVAVGIALFEAAIIGMLYNTIHYFIQYYVTNVNNLAKDIKQKSGIYVDIPIIRKTYFEHINAYYLFFDHHKLPHLQVPANAFQQYNEGDTYPLLIGMYSGVMMNEFYDFDL